MTGDLSAIHEPVSSLFGNGNGSETELSIDQVASFEKNGFLSGIDLLSPSQVEALRNDLSALVDSDGSLLYEFNRNESTDPGRIVFHALGAWRVSPAFHDLVFHAALVRMAGQLLGGPVRLWHDQVFVKPANDGGGVAWHQDYSYWTRTEPMAHLTCWIALDDADEANGCVRYVPGSHRWPLLPRTTLASNMTSILELLDDEQRQAFRPVANTAKAGQISFHHPLMLHGSYENNSLRPRRAAVINYIRDGVRSASDEPLLEGVPVIPSGQKLEGQFFPLLSRE